MNQLKIGRNSDNDVVLSQGGVSKYHALLTPLSEHVMILEDLDSTNGTFVNGYRIRRTLVKPTDVVMLSKTAFPLAIYFKQNSTPSTPEKADNDYTKEFEALKQVYETYKEGRLEIKNGTNLKKGLMSGVIMMVGNAIFPGFGSVVGSIVRSTYADPEEKLVALSEEFRIAYTCPKCKRFLGELPWQTLANQRTCVSCKAIWIHE